MTISNPQKSIVYVAMQANEIRAQVVAASSDFEVREWNLATEAFPIVPEGWSAVVVIGELELQALRSQRLTFFDQSIPTILLTKECDPDLLVVADQLGICEYQCPPYSPEQLAKTLRRMLEVGKHMNYAALVKSQVHNLLANLTERERDVIDSVVAGKANKAIAASLGISEKTVETHRARAMRKLNASNVSELIHIVIASRIAAKSIMHLPINLYQSLNLSQQRA